MDQLWGGTIRNGVLPLKMRFERKISLRSDLYIIIQKYWGHLHRNAFSFQFGWSLFKNGSPLISQFTRIAKGSKFNLWSSIYCFLTILCLLSIMTLLSFQSFLSVFSHLTKIWSTKWNRVTFAKFQDIFPSMVHLCLGFHVYTKGRITENISSIIRSICLSVAVF